MYFSNQVRPILDALTLEKVFHLMTFILILILLTKWNSRH